MPQIIFPFYYFADLAIVLSLLGAGIVLVGVYFLPNFVRHDAACVALSSSVILLSPLEQFTAPALAGFDLFGISASVTTLGAWTLLAAIIFTLLFSLVSRSLIGDKFSIRVNALVASISAMVSGEGRLLRTAPLLPFFVSLFTFILFLNLSGNVPYGYSVTSSLVVALGLSLTVWFYCLFVRLASKGIHFFAHFVPQGTPIALVPLLVLIETISYSARALSLGVRLFANMLAGHTLLAILSGFLGKLVVSSVLVSVICIVPFGIFVALVGLEIAVSFIQAYVFLVLTHSYVTEATGN